MEAIIIMVVFLLAVIGIVFYLQNRIAQIQTTAFDKSENKDLDNTQDLLPFKKIDKSLVDLGNNRYVAYLKVPAYNYIIRSGASQDAWEQGLKYLFNSLDYKVELFTHSRKMYNEESLRRLRSEILKVKNTTPELSDYADLYFIRRSTESLKNPNTGALFREKEYYFVIYWEPEGDTRGKSYSQLEKEAIQGLNKRAMSIQQKLKANGMDSHFLTTKEIVSLFISIYRREETNRADLIFNKDYLGAIVSQDKSRDIEQLPAKERLLYILDNAIEQIEYLQKTNKAYTPYDISYMAKVKDYIETLTDKINE